MDHVKNEASNEVRTAPATSGPVRPRRDQFKSSVVIANNGVRVADDLVKQKITEVQPKMIRRQMREQGWTSVKVFDREAYNKAFASYREEQKSQALTTRTTTISEAFDTAEQGHNVRVERALATLLPLYNGINDRKAVDAFKKIIRVIAASTPNFIEVKKSSRAKGSQEAAVH